MRKFLLGLSVSGLALSSAWAQQPVNIFGTQGGTVTTGGTSQVLAAANPFRYSLSVSNPGTALAQGIGQLLAAVPVGLAQNSIIVRGTGYSPGGTATLAGGTFTQAAVVTHYTTGVSSDYTPTLAAGGSGCGADATGVTFTGTTGTLGTGGRPTLLGSISGGAAIGPFTIIYEGDFLANPTDITQEPFTSGTCTGVKIAIKMGPRRLTVLTPGEYSLFPTGALTESSSSGGTGATYTGTFGGPAKHLYVALGQSASRTGGNLWDLAPNDTRELGPNNIYQGAINITSEVDGQVYYMTEFTK